MWLWLLVLLATASEAAPVGSSNGPSSAEEASVLWTEGQKAFDLGNYQKATQHFQRYIDRYPGQSGYLKAHFLIGKSYLELGQTAEAVGPLKDFVTASAVSSASAEARVLLGRIFLKEKKFHEAQLIAKEIEEVSSSVDLDPDVLIQALVVKSQALLGLGHETQSIEASEAAEKQMSEKNSLSTRSAVFENQLRLKTLFCNKFPSTEKLAESQLRSQLDRRGTCLLEAILIFQKVLKTQIRSYAIPAGAEIESAFENYAESCAHPKMTRSIAKKRTLQNIRYQAELADLLVQECKEKIHTAAKLMESWKIDPAPGIQKSLQKLASQTGSGSPE